jgi:DNA-binding transcriptional regulator YdaS (Cro superfamily)
MMNSQQRETSVAALLRACRRYKTHDHMSMATGIPRDAFSRYLNGSRDCSPVHAALIEKHTGGDVKRHELRPDLYAAPAARAPYAYDGLSTHQIKKRHREAAKAAGVGPVRRLAVEAVAKKIADEIKADVKARADRKHESTPKRAGATSKPTARKPKVT